MSSQDLSVHLDIKPTPLSQDLPSLSQLSEGTAGGECPALSVHTSNAVILYEEKPARLHVAQLGSSSQSTRARGLCGRPAKEHVL